MGGEGLAVIEQAFGRGGELALVAAGEGVDFSLRCAHGRLAGLGVLGQVEDRPELGLELVAALGGDLGQHVE